MQIINEKRSAIWIAILATSIVSQMPVSAQDGLPTNSQKPSPQQQFQYDWPGFLGGRRDGRSSQTSIRKDWSNGNLPVVWKRKLGAGYSLGSSYQGNYYQLDAEGNSCRLFCLNEQTGKEVWNFQYAFEYRDMYGFDNGPRCTPIIDDGLVYIFGVTGMLHCLNAKSGELVWKVDTQKRFGVVQNFFGVGSTPMVSGEQLIVMVGGSPKSDQAKGNRLDEVSPNGSGVVVFNKRTGQVLHQLIDDLASYASINLYRDKQAVRAVAWMRENLVGIDIENGRQLWKYRFRARKYESVNASTPVINGSQVMVSESYGPGTVVLDVADDQPKVVWKDKNRRSRSLATHWNTPVLHQGFVYACNGEGRANTDIRCVEWKTGKVSWKKPGYGRASLTYVDDHFVVLDEKGELLLIKADPTKFQLVTKYSDTNGERLPLKYPCWAAPVISNGLMFVRGKDELICLKLASD